MVKKYQVEDYEMDGGELDTFYKLFWFGSQNDGDLPSKSGMAGLIEKGLATKNYHIRDIFPGLKPNSLSITGDEVAKKYYHKKYRQSRKRTVMRFKDLPVGARFNYPDSNETWVVIQPFGNGLIAKWEGIIPRYRQSICSFVDDDWSLDSEVFVEETSDDKKPLSPNHAKRTRNINIAREVICGASLSAAGKTHSVGYVRIQQIVRQVAKMSLHPKLEPGKPPCSQNDLVEMRKYKDYWLERFKKLATYWGLSL